MYAGHAFADVGARASVDRPRVGVGEPVELNVTIKGAQGVSAPDVQIDGFLVSYLGPSTSVSIVNGVMSSSVTHMYSLLPQREGHFTIGPIAVDVSGKKLETNPVTVEVVPASAVRSAGVDQDTGQTAAADDRLRLQLTVDKQRAYVNQAIPARVQLLVGRGGIGGIEPPKLEAEGFLVKPVGEPKQSEVIIDGETWQLVEFDMTVVPIRSGALTLGPATLESQVRVRQRPSRNRPPSPFQAQQDFFEQFFGRDSMFEEFFTQIVPVRLRAEPVQIEVLPLPEEGRPADFSGAVGHFSLDAKTIPSAVTVGEPVTVTMTVSGEGNFDTVTAPQLSVDPGQFKRYEPKVTDSGEGAAVSQKVFEQVVIPLDTAVHELPAVHFSSFNPSAGRYETVTKGPFPLAVKPAPVQERVNVISRPQLSALPVQPVSPPEPLGRDIVFIKDELGSMKPVRWRWYASPWWVGWQLLPLLLFAAGEWLRRRREQLASDPGAVRAGGAMKRALAQCRLAQQLGEQGKEREVCAEIVRAMQRYIGDRLNVPAEGLTRVEFERLLRPRGAPEELMRELLDLFDRCDVARFAPSSSGTIHHSGEMIRSAESLLKRLDRWKPA